MQGLKIGLLTVGNLVPIQDWSRHPGYRLLPNSHKSKKAQIRDCGCVCGARALYNEKMLKKAIDKNIILHCGNISLHRTSEQRLYFARSEINRLEGDIQRFKGLLNRSILPNDINRLKEKIASLKQELLLLKQSPIS